MKRFLDHYAGFIAVVADLSGLLICMLIHPINLHQPGSQYGYYNDTRILFGLTFTLFSLFMLIFSRHLQRYWSHAILIGLLGGFFLTATGWVPYQPTARSIVFDVHDISVILAIIFYSLLAGGLARQTKDSKIAKTSRYCFLLLSVTTLLSIVARSANHWLLGAQILVVGSCLLWIALINIYVVQDEPWTRS